jgi:uncharacterized membrane protein YphA (DoxX/SURF4 family)
MKASYLLGRMMFGGFFLYSGINHLKQTEGMAQYTASKGVPAPELAVKATGIALIAGGTSVLLGLKKEWGAAAIAAFLVGASPLMHDFWNHEDQQKRQNDMIHFAKNLGLLGASLMLMGLENPREKQAASDLGDSESEQDWQPAHTRTAA